MAVKERTFTITSHRRDWVFPMAPDGKHLFTSDTHYDHGNIIRYSSRPYLNPEEQEIQNRRERFKVSAESVARMNDALVERFNKIARPQDVIWHMGDLAWNGVEKAREFLGRLVCKNIILVWGNHDEPEFADVIPRMKARPKLGNSLGDEQLILPCYDQCFAVVDGQKMHLSHYPGDSWEASHKGVWHLYGHVHGAKNDRHKRYAGWALSVDVGVDSHDYRPWTLDELRALFTKRYPEWESDRAHLRDKEDGGMTPLCKIE